MLSKNLYLCSLKQPIRWASYDRRELWIAFKKLVSLLFETTDSLVEALMPNVVNCFQKTCIFALWNNVPFWVVSVNIVVNCFQKTCIFALWNNLISDIQQDIEGCELLSKNLYLCSLKQPSLENPDTLPGCELLSKNLYLCSLKQQWFDGEGNFLGCELLSKNLYLCSLKQPIRR